MTARQRQILGWIGLGGLLALLNAASAVGVARYQLEQKADRSEVDDLKTQLETDRRILNRIDGRVSAMYCGQVPEQHRAGCQ